MKHLAYLFVILIFSIALMSCKDKNLSTGDLPPRLPKDIIKDAERNRLDVTGLHGKAKIKFDDGNSKITATAFIRLNKGEAIWFSVRKLGIEAARVIITPDSIGVLDRINKQYLSGDFVSMSDRFSLPSTGDPAKDYQLLEEIVIGNPVFFDKKNTKAGSLSPHYILTTQAENYLYRYEVRGDNYLTEKTEIGDLLDTRSMAISTINHQKIDNVGVFSYFRIINIKSQETGDISIELKWSSISLNETKSINFEIPDNYTKM